MIKEYLTIQNNVVTNICVWDGNTDTWQPPEDALMLVKETTPAKIWSWDPEVKDFVLIDSVGTAERGFIFDGSSCITNEPKPNIQPAPDQPESTGTQDL